LKTILTIFCCIIILFGGGCAVLLSESGASQIALLPIAVVALNLAVLAALYGWASMPAWPLYILSVIDVILALGIGAVAFYSIRDVGNAALLGLIPAFIVALKGYLTIKVAQARGPEA
jgi:hypothetical protein